MHSLNPIMYDNMNLFNVCSRILNIQEYRWIFYCCTWHGIIYCSNLY